MVFTVAQSLVDSQDWKRDFDTAMKAKAASPKKKQSPVDYPETTKGSKVAAEIRARANKLTSEERRSHFKQAMAMIYAAGENTRAHRTGH